MLEDELNLESLPHQFKALQHITHSLKPNLLLRASRPDRRGPGFWGQCYIWSSGWTGRELA